MKSKGRILPRGIQVKDFIARRCRQSSDKSGFSVAFYDELLFVTLFHLHSKEESKDVEAPHQQFIDRHDGCK